MMTRGTSVKPFNSGVPRITTSGAAVPSLVRLCLPELPAPVAHRFRGEDDAACRHELFDVQVAQPGAAIQPHAVTDKLGREAMAFIRVGLVYSCREYATRG